MPAENVHALAAPCPPGCDPARLDALSGGARSADQNANNEDVVLVIHQAFVPGGGAAAAAPSSAARASPAAAAVVRSREGACLTPSGAPATSRLTFVDARNSAELDSLPLTGDTNAALLGLLHDQGVPAATAGTLPSRGSSFGGGVLSRAGGGGGGSGSGSGNNGGGAHSRLNSPAAALSSLMGGLSPGSPRTSGVSSARAWGGGANGGTSPALRESLRSSGGAGFAAALAEIQARVQPSCPVAVDQVHVVAAFGTTLVVWKLQRSLPPPAEVRAHAGGLAGFCFALVTGQSVLWVSLANHQSPPPGHCLL